MSVILFYALLITAMALVFAAYIALMIVPIGLIAYRFGLVVGAIYTVALAGIGYTLFEPPYGGVSLDFVPAGMRPNLFIVGLFQNPPVSMLIATAALSTAGLVSVLIAWLFRRA